MTTSPASTSFPASPTQTLVVGIGSPHGDDQAGWLVAREVTECDARLAKSPADLLDWIADFDRLIVCDACQGLGAVGTARRWDWPSDQLPNATRSGTHDLSLPQVLHLCDTLGWLPREVIIWGIESRPGSATTPMSPEVQLAIPEVARQIHQTLQTVSLVPKHAPHDATSEEARCTSSR
ncbi:MAG: hydrogenase maturation protease [Planctomycetaceae bacterium]